MQGITTTSKKHHLFKFQLLNQILSLETAALFLDVKWVIQGPSKKEIGPEYTLLN